MKAVLRSSEKENVALIEDQFLIFDTESNETSNEVLSVLLESIVSKTQIEILYQKPGDNKADKRLLEPIGIFYEYDYWYFMAFCHLRNDYRQFRIDRVKQIVNTEVCFNHTHQKLDHFLNAKKQTEVVKTTVKILAPKKSAHYFNWDKNTYGFVSERELEDKMELTFETTTHLQYFARWFLMFAAEAEITEPLELKQIVADLLKKAIEKCKIL